MRDFGDAVPLASKEVQDITFFLDCYPHQDHPFASFVALSLFDPFALGNTRRGGLLLFCSRSTVQSCQSEKTTIRGNNEQQRATTRKQKTNRTNEAVTTTPSSSTTATQLKEHFSCLFLYFLILNCSLCNDELTNVHLHSNWGMERSFIFFFLLFFNPF